MLKITLKTSMAWVSVAILSFTLILAPPQRGWADREGELAKQQQAFRAGMTVATRLLLDFERAKDFAHFLETALKEIKGQEVAFTAGLSVGAQAALFAIIRDFQLQALAMPEISESAVKALVEKTILAHQDHIDANVLRTLLFAFGPKSKGEGGANFEAVARRLFEQRNFLLSLGVILDGHGADFRKVDFPSLTPIQKERLRALFRDPKNTLSFADRYEAALWLKVNNADLQANDLRCAILNGEHVYLPDYQGQKNRRMSFKDYERQVKSTVEEFNLIVKTFSGAMKDKRAGRWSAQSYWKKYHIEVSVAPDIALIRKARALRDALHDQYGLDTIACLQSIAQMEEAVSKNIDLEIAEIDTGIHFAKWSWMVPATMYLGSLFMTRAGVGFYTKEGSRILNPVLYGTGRLTVSAAATKNTAWLAALPALFSGAEVLGGEIIHGIATEQFNAADAFLNTLFSLREGTGFASTMPAVIGMLTRGASPIAMVLKEGGLVSKVRSVALTRTLSRISLKGIHVGFLVLMGEHALQEGRDAALHLSRAEYEAAVKAFWRGGLNFGFGLYGATKTWGLDLAPSALSRFYEFGQKESQASKGGKPSVSQDIEDALTIHRAQELFPRSLPEQAKKAILKAHRYGIPQKNKEGELVYSQGEKVVKMLILRREGGFSQAEAKLLGDKNVVGLVVRVDPERRDDLLGETRLFNRAMVLRWNGLVYRILDTVESQLNAGDLDQRDRVQQVSRWIEELRGYGAHRITVRMLRLVASRFLQNGKDSFAKKEGLAEILLNNRSNKRFPDASAYGEALLRIYQLAHSSKALPISPVGFNQQDGAEMRLIKFLGPDAAELVPRLVQELHQEDEQRQINALRALSYIGSPALEALPEIREKLRHKNEQIAEFAAKVVGSIGAEARETIPALKRLLNGDSQADVRLAVVRALVQMGSLRREDVLDLISLLKERDPLLQKEAILALRKIGVEKGLMDLLMENLIRIAKEGYFDISKEAIEFIGEMGGAAASATPTLCGLLGERELSIKHAALSALSRLPATRESVSHLIPLLRHSQASIRKETARALGIFGMDLPGVVSGLRKLLVDEDQGVCRQAVVSLGMLGPASLSALPELKKISEEAYYAASEDAKRIVDELEKTAVVIQDPNLSQERKENLAAEILRQKQIRFDGLTQQDLSRIHDQEKLAQRKLSAFEMAGVIEISEVGGRKPSSRDQGATSRWLQEKTEKFQEYFGEHEEELFKKSLKKGIFG